MAAIAPRPERSPSIPFTSRLGMTAAPPGNTRIESGRRKARTIALDDVMVASKLTRPVSPAMPVPRPRLIERLDAHLASPIVALVAPPGYGKSTLLSQWVAAGKRRAAWLTVDSGDNNPAMLAEYVDLALVRAGIDGSRPFVLVIDNAERLTNPAAIAPIVALADTFTTGTQVAIATRTIGNWPIPRLCASAKAICLGTRDLMLTDDEAAELLARAGLPVAPPIARRLNRAADGWAAALYLHATGSPKAREEWLDGDAGAETDGDPSADSSLLAEYVRGEILSSLRPEEREFLVKTSMLDQLHPSLCDSVLGRAGSDEILQRIYDANGLLMRNAGDGNSYRLPSMIRTVLRLEHERSGGDSVRLAHARAAQWYEDQGLIVDAAAQAAKGPDRKALSRLLPSAIRRALADGRADEAADWIRQLEATGYLAPKTDLAAPVALIYASLGDGPASERWSEGAWAAAASDRRREPLAEAAIARAFVCRWGWPQMRADARLALRLLPSGDDRAPIAQLLLAVADLLAADTERAEAGLGRASRAASAVRDDGWATAIALAFRASLAHAGHDRSTTEALLREARAMIIRGGLDGEPAGVLVRALGARVAASRGLYAQARGDLEIAQANARVATAAMPWLALRARLDLAAALLSLSDLAGATSALDDVHGLLRERPRLGTLEVEAGRLEQQLQLARAMSQRDVALTAAELRLMPYLATHLGMSEIAARLFVSTNTVKTEAKSIYRKLAVSCRSDAIERATKIGLLEPRDDIVSATPLEVVQAQVNDASAS